MISNRDSWDEQMLIECDWHRHGMRPSTVLKKGRRIVRVLNEGEKVLGKTKEAVSA